MTRFSIIIVNYNKLNYLKLVAKRVRHLAKQSELILSDDHSDDGSVNWAKKSGIFNRIYRKPKRESYCLCTARNEGIKLSTRPHIVILDADCLPEPNYFKSLTFLLNMWKDKRPTVAVGFTDQYNKAGTQMLLEDHRKSYLNKDGICSMGWRDSFGGNICFPKSLWDKVGHFDEDFNGFWGFEDLDFAFRCQESGARIAGRRGILVRHLQHPLRSEFQQSQLRGRNWELFCKKHPGVK